jgi:CubicO group peptidase (beta-lactamase class C family)
VDKAAVEAAGAQMVGPNKGDSVVVIHSGRLVYEKYADHVTPDTVLPSFSVSKSFTSTMIGLLVDDGKLALDRRAPINAWSAPTDPRRAITLRNILNMSSGLQWNENYSDAQSDVFQMVAAGDESSYVIAKPLDAKPGSRWQYSTGDTAVLGRIIGDTAHVSGAAYQAYLHKRLFDPLGINPVVAGVDRAGRWRAGWQTNTTTRNFAKLGLLYLRDGVWENKQFLSSSWVNFVRTPSPAYLGYGGQFWLDGDGSFRMIGLYGQTVHIIPDLDLIIAINNGGSDFPMVDAFRNAQAPSCGAAPAAVNDTASVRALGAVGVDVLANDRGGAAGLAPATLTISRAATHGTTEVVGDRIRYRSEGGFTGHDTFGYLVCTNDRRRCVEATVTVNVLPLPFTWRPPVRNHRVNTRSPGHSVLIRFQTPAGKTAVKAVTSVAVDCRNGNILGAHEPVEAQLHAKPHRGVVSFRWSTTPTWTGCRDLEVALADAKIHTAHFRWRTKR